MARIDSTELRARLERAVEQLEQKRRDPQWRTRTYERDRINAQIEGVLLALACLGDAERAAPEAEWAIRFRQAARETVEPCFDQADAARRANWRNKVDADYEAVVVHRSVTPWVAAEATRIERESRIDDDDSARRGPYLGTTGPEGRRAVLPEPDLPAGRRPVLFQPQDVDLHQGTTGTLNPYAEE